MLKLYYSPGTCALASHAALEEAGLPYVAVRVNLQKGENRSDPYLRINGWGRVPALEVDGVVLTENAAILQYLADSVPSLRLLPPSGTFARARAVEWMALLSGTVHTAFRSTFRPLRFARSEAAQQDVTSTGLVTLNHTLGLIERGLGDNRYVLGENFSLCDLYLFVFAMWTERPMLRGKLDPLPRLHAFARRIAERRSMSAALADEGLVFPAG